MSFDYDPNFPHSDNNLIGGYILLPAYDAAATMDESDEAPVSYYAIKKTDINQFVGGDDIAVEHWLSEFTYDDSTELLGFGLLSGGVIFEYHPNADNEFDKVNITSKEAMCAFIDFVSGKLQEAGETEASKYLDAMFSL